MNAEKVDPRWRTTLYKAILWAFASFGAMVLLFLIGGAIWRAGVWLWAWM